jgi:hypothetical protein
MGKFSWFSEENIERKVRGDGLYISSLEFAKNYQPKADTDYRWVMEYANSEYKRYEAILNGIDSKADSLIRYMGAGSGVIALVFTYALAAKGWLSALQVLPTLAMFFTSMVFASKARTPEKMTAPPNTEAAIKYAHAYATNSATASFAAMTGTASIGLKIAIREKARLVRLAFHWFLCGVSWLVLIAIVTTILRVFGLYHG